MCPRCEELKVLSSIENWANLTKTFVSSLKITYFTKFYSFGESVLLLYFLKSLKY